MAAFDFHIGARVHCSDGRAGRLVRIVVEPKTQHVTDLIVEKGVLFKTDRVLPVSAVVAASETDIHLRMCSEEVNCCAEFREITVQEPASIGDRYQHLTGIGPSSATYTEPYVPMVRKRRREGIPCGSAIIDCKTGVESLTTVIGYVEHVIVDGETEEITHLIVRKGLIPSYIMVPAEKIKGLGEEIFIPLTQEEVVDLPRYQPRSQTEILYEVHERLAASSDLSSVTAQIVDGVLHLTGSVKNSIVYRHAEHVVASVPGVAHVDNHLVVSDTISADPAQDVTQPLDLNVVGELRTVLATDTRTRGASIDLIVDRSLVILMGDVNSMEVRQAAEEIVRQHACVTTVENKLQAPMLRQP